MRPNNDTKWVRKPAGHTFPQPRINPFHPALVIGSAKKTGAPNVSASGRCDRACGLTNPVATFVVEPVACAGVRPVAVFVFEPVAGALGRWQVRLLGASIVPGI